MEERRGMKQKRSCGWKENSAGMIQEILEQEKGEMVATEEGLAAGVWKREEWGWEEDWLSELGTRKEEEAGGKGKVGGREGKRRKRVAVWGKSEGEEAEEIAKELRWTRKKGLRIMEREEDESDKMQSEEEEETTEDETEDAEEEKEEKEKKREDATRKEEGAGGKGVAGGSEGEGKESGDV
ncbi:hypothetical protein RF55_16289 [Lasius niger]|uniref:Uncharacterized protein n=2 Tax=Lasius niger TaxID=67767 RepID=A0A0J7MXW1_LASNI|nr:hypothetical protein RF55_16289 [Lasius niger]